MNEVLFLLFAFLTIFLSIKLSYYADAFSKTSNVSSALIGGVLLASVTSLPELVTCFSAVAVSNTDLAVGDILGSNIFNIFMICTFDLIFIKKAIFSKINKSHSLIFILIIINYIFLYLFITEIVKLSLYYIGIPTFVILITYFYYLFKVTQKNEEKTVLINDSNNTNLVLKLAITAVFMVFSSVILTVLVNNIAKSHPLFSSSFLGAIFLGITTSLPEVVTCYTLINKNSYDLALSDIIGSNLFNLFILAIADFSVRKASIYSFANKEQLMLVGLGLLFTFLLFGTIKLKKEIYKSLYGLFSIIIVILYLCYWILNFLLLN